MFQNLRFAVRTLRRNPGFTALAVLTIALGIGLNTAVFSVVNGILLRPLVFADPARLIKISETKGQFNSNVSYPNFRDWQRRAASFNAMAIYNSYDSVTFKTPEGNEVLGAADASWNLFQVLGVNPALGRSFTPEDDKGDGAAVALITNQMWVERFGKTPDIVGKQAFFSGIAITIIGVLPPTFHLSNAGIWFPMGEVKNPIQLDRGNHPGFEAVGRLKPGVTLEHARLEMSSIAASLAREYPATNKQYGIRLTPMFDVVVGHVRSTLLVLFGAVSFVMLIACANVANLLLARAIDRDREIAVRTSLGATRWHVVRMMLSESLLLSAAGTALGALVATWGVDLLLSLQPDALPAGRPIAMDATVFGYTIFLMLVSTVIFGLAPSWRTIRSDLSGALKQGGRGSTAAKSTERVRAALIAAEVALSIALLAGAGLMIRSLYALQHEEMGFRARNLVALQIQLSGQDQKAPATMTQRAY